MIDSDYEFFQRMGTEERALAFVTQVNPWEAPNPHECGAAHVLREFGEWYQVHRPVAGFPLAAAMFFTGKLGDCGGQAVIGGLCTQVRRADLGYGMVVVSSNEAASSQQKPGLTAFRVRAQVGRDLAEYSAVVGITIP